MHDVHELKTRLDEWTYSISENLIELSQVVARLAQGDTQTIEVRRSSGTVHRQLAAVAHDVTERLQGLRSIV